MMHESSSTSFIWTKTSGNEWSVRRAPSDGYPEDFNRFYLDGVLTRAWPGSDSFFGNSFYATSGGCGFSQNGHLPLVAGDDGELHVRQ